MHTTALASRTAACPTNAAPAAHAAIARASAECTSDAALATELSTIAIVSSRFSTLATGCPTTPTPAVTTGDAPIAATQPRLSAG